MSFGKLYTYDVSISISDFFLLGLKLTLFYQGNARSTAIRAVAKANNLDLEVVHTEPAKGVSNDYLKLHKLGKVPSFVGADGYELTECIAIAIYGITLVPCVQKTLNPAAILLL